jgi:protein tyrosine phosphatase (PTP) superfamily phosphohydrolase (DUF442 family)
MINRTVAVFILLILVMPAPLGWCDGGAAGPTTSAPPLKIEDVEGVAQGNLYLDGRVYIAGQPSEEAFAELARRGVTVEESVVRELGMDYVSIPLGGDDHPYEPAAVERLAEALAADEGNVVIHCLYGIRAVYLWLAYLIQNEGLSLEQAMARGEAMMLKPHPVGRLLDRPTQLVFVQ